MPSWSDDLGRRIGAVMERLGPDTSVAVTGKSWKQLGRYREGAEPPAGVLKGLADAAGVSLAYLVDGVITVTQDAEIERSIIDEQLERVREDLKTAKSSRLRKLREIEQQLVERSAFLGKIGAALLNRRKYPRSYDDYLSQNFERLDHQIDPGVVREIQEYFGIPRQGRDTSTDRGLADEYVFLPRYGVQAGAGAGRDTSAEDVVERLAFRRDWVRNVLRLEPRNLVLIEAHGNSMVPTFKSGDVLMVHTAETKLRHGLVYAMSVEGDLVVKRVDRRADGTLVLRSDNPDFPPEEIPPGRAEQLRIIGRVVWVGGTID